MQSGGGGDGKTSKYYTHWHLAKHIEQLLSERERDGLISGQLMPTQTTVLASFHCQHLRFESKFSTLCSQFLFPLLFFPPTIWFVFFQRSQSVFHRLRSQSLWKYSGRNSDPDADPHCINKNRPFLILSQESSTLTNLLSYFEEEEEEKQHMSNYRQYQGGQKTNWF